MKIKVNRIEKSKFEAVNEDGNSLIMDGPEIVGGQKSGVRPMELILSGLAGCAGVDVLLILQKGRHTIEDLQIEVEGHRVDAIPSVFEKIEVIFSASGSFNEKQLNRAVNLSMEKYCSVVTMLKPTVKIEHRAIYLNN